jgi:S1-C subfamily serine protease
MRDDDRPDDPSQPDDGWRPDDDPGRDDASGHTPDPDDLDGFETPRMRILRRLRIVVAAVVALALLLPSGRWLWDELGFRTSRDDIAAELGPDAGLVDALWLVRAFGCDGRVSSGSGFTLSTDGGPVIVTNRHVVAESARVSVRPLAGGATVNVDDYRLSTSADVAVLELPASAGGGDAEVAVAALSTALDPVAGDEVRVVGFPGGRPTLTDGSVRTSDGQRVEVAVPTAPGASGSPVLDGTGGVVAQIFARSTDGAGIATSSSALRRAVADAVPQEEVEGPTCAEPASP